MGRRILVDKGHLAQLVSLGRLFLSNEWEDDVLRASIDPKFGGSSPADAGAGVAGARENSADTKIDSRARFVCA